MERPPTTLPPLSPFFELLKTRTVVEVEGDPTPDEKVEAYGHLIVFYHGTRPGVIVGLSPIARRRYPGAQPTYTEHHLTEGGTRCSCSGARQCPTEGCWVMRAYASALGYENVPALREALKHEKRRQAVNAMAVASNKHKPQTAEEWAAQIEKDFGN
jgi:hypothetical protein